MTISRRRDSHCPAACALALLALLAIVAGCTPEKRDVRPESVGSAAGTTPG